jgi:2-succinyl-5-enolpyruvyl-6-hydroxy-3-cyclohexene-1-carboxylate synthase
MIAMPYGTITFQNFKIILINNGGGGIFRILPGHEETSVFNTFFETSHCLTARTFRRCTVLNIPLLVNQA